jgi:hypothetical protein
MCGGEGFTCFLGFLLFPVVCVFPSAVCWGLLWWLWFVWRVCLRALLGPEKTGPFSFWWGWFFRAGCGFLPLWGWGLWCGLFFEFCIVGASIF